MDQAKKLREMMKDKNKLTEEKQDLVKNTPETNKVSKGKKAKILSVSSGKGGVGKTNFSINTAIALKDMGNEVLILDADIGLSNVEILSGTDVLYSISDIVFSDKNIEDALSEGPSGIKILSGGSGLKELTLLSGKYFEKIIKILNKLQKMFDFIIIDTGAGISAGVIDFILASDEVVIVSTPDPTSIMDAYVLIKSLDINKFNGKINIITNFVKDKSEGFNVFSKLNNASKQFLKVEIEYLGYIVEDKTVSNAVRNQLPFIISHPNKSISKQVKNIAIKLSDSSNSIEKTESFGRRLLNLFSRDKF